MAEQRSDDDQRLTAGGGDRGERMPKIVDADIVETGGVPDPSPWLLDIDQMGSFPPTSDDIWIAINAGQGGQDLKGRGVLRWISFLPLLESGSGKHASSN